MKGLIHLPTIRELAKAYATLQATKAPPLPAARLALWSQWARLDPRLAEQLVSHLAAHWRGLNPLELRAAIQKQPWPAALGVLLDQLREASGTEERALLKPWIALVLAGVAPARNEQFFIGLRAFAGKLMIEDARLSHRSYLRWGFLGREVLVNKAKAIAGFRTRLSASTRRCVLDELLRDRQRLTARDYREALDNQVTARVAEKDLLSHPRLTPRSNTRGRYYVVKPAGATRRGADRALSPA